MGEPSFSEFLNLSSSNRILNKSLASPLDELIQSTRYFRIPKHESEQDSESELQCNQTGTTSTTLTGGDPFFGESLMSVSYSYALGNSTRHCLVGGDRKHGFYDSSLETSFFRGLNCSLGKILYELTNLLFHCMYDVILQVRLKLKS